MEGSLKTAPSHKSGGEPHRPKAPLQPSPSSAGPGNQAAQEAQADRLASIALHAGATSSSGVRPDNTGPVPPPARPGGAPLTGLREPLEAVTGMSMASVRVHDAPHLGRALRARAFAHGSDIYAGSGASNLMLAHEAIHTAQQALTGRAGIQLWIDPTQGLLTDAEVETWNNDQVISGISALVSYLEPSVLSEDTRAGGTANLRILIHAAFVRQMTIPEGLLNKLPAGTIPEASEATLFSMNGKLDLISAMIRRDFPNDWPFVEADVDYYRTLYPWLTNLDLADAVYLLDSSVAAMETAGRIKRLAIDPGGDAEVSSAIERLAPRSTIR
jgi:hypothetical protein